MLTVQSWKGFGPVALAADDGNKNYGINGSSKHLMAGTFHDVAKREAAELIALRAHLK
jgi:hypothetical protein